MIQGKVDVLLGLQWGDEGKGKVVDVLTPQYDVIARFQGGPNAGHTLEFEGQKYVLRSIPSGIFQGGKVNIIGNGVVLAPDLFMEEALVADTHDAYSLGTCFHRTQDGYVRVDGCLEYGVTQSADEGSNQEEYKAFCPDSGIH